MADRDLEPTDERGPGQADVPPPHQTGLRRHGPALALAAVLGGAGVMHFVRPEFFDPLVPPVLGAPRPWTIASGVAEVAVALLLASPRTRRLGGWAAAMLLVAVFPGNIYLAIQGAHPGLDFDGQRWVHLARLPLQVPLILWAVWVARNAPR